MFVYNEYNSRASVCRLREENRTLNNMPSERPATDPIPISSTFVRRPRTYLTYSVPSLDINAPSFPYPFSSSYQNLFTSSLIRRPHSSDTSFSFSPIGSIKSRVLGRNVGAQLQVEQNEQQTKSAKDFPVPCLIDHTKLVIGPNDTKLSKELYDSIPWPNVKAIHVDDILVDVFGREILASHTIYEPPIPFYYNMPVPPILSPEAIDDIIGMICSKSKLPAIYIRSLVNAKCIYEAHMSQVEAREEGDELTEPKPT